MIIICLQPKRMQKTLSTMGRLNTLSFSTTTFEIWFLQGEVILQHIFTSSMMVDPLTKSIIRDLFFSDAKSMGLHRI